MKTKTTKTLKTQSQKIQDKIDKLQTKLAKTTKTKNNKSKLAGIVIDIIRLEKELEKLETPSQPQPVAPTTPATEAEVKQVEAEAPKPATIATTTAPKAVEIIHSHSGYDYRERFTWHVGGAATTPKAEEKQVKPAIPTGDELVSEIRRLIKEKKAVLQSIPHSSNVAGDNLNATGWTLYNHYRSMLMLNSEKSLQEIYTNLVAIG